MSCSGTRSSVRENELPQMGFKPATLYFLDKINVQPSLPPASCVALLYFVDSFCSLINDTCIRLIYTGLVACAVLYD